MSTNRKLSKLKNQRLAQINHIEGLRKKAMVWFASVSIVLGVFVLWQQARGAAAAAGASPSSKIGNVVLYSCAAVSIEGQSLYAGRSKYGFDEYTNLSLLEMKVYSTQVIGTTNTSTNYETYHGEGGSNGNGATIHEGDVTNKVSQIYQVSQTGHYDPLTGTFTQDWSGSIFSYNEGQGPGSSYVSGSCAVNITNSHQLDVIESTISGYSTNEIVYDPDTGTVPLLTNVIYAPKEVDTTHHYVMEEGSNGCDTNHIWVTDTTITTTNWDFNLTLFSDEPSVNQDSMHFIKISNTNMITDSGSTSFQLTQEYTTASLIGNTLTDLGDFNDEGPWDGGANAAFALSNGRRGCEITKSRFRYSFYADDETTYAVTIRFNISGKTEYVGTNILTGLPDVLYVPYTKYVDYYGTRLISGHNAKVENVITYIPEQVGDGLRFRIDDPAGTGLVLGGDSSIYEISVGIISVVPVGPDCNRCGLAGGSSGGLGNNNFGFGSSGAGGHGNTGGFGSFGGLLPGGGSVAIGSVDMTVGLGLTEHQQPVGYFYLKGELPHFGLSHPEALQLVMAETNITVVSNTLGTTIEQVKVPQCLANVVGGDSKFEINFYATNAFDPVAGGDGHFSTNGTPEFVKWTVENPDGTNAYNRLFVVEKRGLHSITNKYEYDTNTATMTLITGNNLRKQTKHDYWNTNHTIFNEMTEVIDPATSTTVYKVLRQYIDNPWGRGLTNEIVDPDGAALRTSYSYYTNGVLKQVVWPDGSWRIEEYDGWRKIAIYTGLANQEPTVNSSLCRVLWLDYVPETGTDDDGTFNHTAPRTIRETFLNQEVARTKYVITAAETKTIQVGDSAEDLVTTETRYTSGSFKGKRKSIVYPDGTAELYEYFTNSVASSNVVYAGALNGAGTAITNGTKTITVMGALGEVLRETTIDISSQITIDDEVTTSFDVFRRPLGVQHLNGTQSSADYSCCYLQSETDSDGTVHTYAYDDLKRRISETKHGITISATFDALGNPLSILKQGTNGGTISLVTAGYDLAGRLVYATNAMGYVSTNLYGFSVDGELVTTNLLPGGGTRIEKFYKDGTIQAVTGTATYPVRFEYGADDDGKYVKETKLADNGDDLSEWRKVSVDFFGRFWKIAHSGGATETRSYNELGQLTRYSDADGVSWLYLYNATGEREYTILDTYRDGSPHFSGTNQITRIVRDVVSNHGKNVLRTRTYGWLASGADSPTLLSTWESAVNGFATWESSPAGTECNTWEYFGEANGGETNTAPDNSYVIASFEHDKVTSITKFDSSNQSLGQKFYDYDQFGRRKSVTDARNGTTSYTVNNAGQVSSISTPFPGNGQGRQVTSNIFNAMGFVWKVIQPDGTSVTNEYYATGDLRKMYGSRTYPVQYIYDSQGRLTQQDTWKQFAAGGGEAHTSWSYDDNTGFQAGKRYDDTLGPDYNNTGAGRLSSKTWARAVTTTYGRDNRGKVSHVSYSDDTAPIQKTYTRMGQQQVISHNGATTALSYNDMGQLTGEIYASGVLDGLAITNLYDSLFRRTNHIVLQSGMVIAKTIYTYDSASRLYTVSDGTNAATYHYVPDSSLIAGVVYTQNGVTRLVRTNEYDNVNRLTNLVWRTGTNVISSFAYDFNQADQVTRVTREDGSYWLYQYDSLGQLASAKKYWSNGAPVPAQQNVYAYDDIGNLRDAAEGGNEYGSGLRHETYTANTLNQYSQRTVPAAVDITGTATNNATVTVNSQPVYRFGGFFWKSLGIDNTSAAVYQGVTNLAVLNNGTNQDIVATNIGNVFVPKNPEVFGYDEDGNLTNDGRFSYTWNAENQLIQVLSKDDAPLASKVKLDFAYDAWGRRIEKIVSTNSGSEYVASYTNRFVYDGWNLSAIFDGGGICIRTFTWGSDLSGSLREAGGVGGLIAINDPAAVSNSSFYTFNANGDVVSLVACDSGIVKAEYEYTPFGQLAKGIGTLAKSNVFGFSSKFNDPETGFSYYGYRYYNSVIKRWLNRDLIEEKDGPNPYAFVSNNPLGGVDRNGLDNWHSTGFLGIQQNFVGTVSMPAALVPPQDNPFPIANPDAEFEEEVTDALDIVGVVDPTPIADSVNAINYINNGDGKNAAVSAFGAALPYLGDLGKLGRLQELSCNALKRATRTRKVAFKEFEELFDGTKKLTKAEKEAARKEFEKMKPKAWIEEARRNPKKYSPEQLKDMEKGKAPIGADGHPMEIHHREPLANGGKNDMDNFEFLTRTEHRLGKNFKEKHPNLY